MKNLKFGCILLSIVLSELCFRSSWYPKNKELVFINSCFYKKPPKTKQKLYNLTSSFELATISQLMAVY